MEKSVINENVQRLALNRIQFVKKSMFKSKIGSKIKSLPVFAI